MPPLWEPELVNEIQTDTTSAAKAMAHRLVREEGIFAGTSSGANVVAASRIAQRLGPGATVVTIICEATSAALPGQEDIGAELNAKRHLAMVRTIDNAEGETAIHSPAESA